MERDLEVSISVIIPVFNVEKYVCQCIDSILKQTFQDIEIIVIDDASTDASYEIVTKKYGNVPKVKILQNKKNLGLGRTRNVGMKEARGKYLYFIDSDDALLRKGLETMYVEAEANEADVLHMSGWYVPHEEDFVFGDKIAVSVKKDPGYVPHLYRLPLKVECRLEEAYGLSKLFGTVWLNLYKRSFLLDKQIFFPDMIHEDDAFAIAVYAATDRIYSYPGAFYLYRQRNKSIMREHSYAKLEMEIKALVIGLRYVGRQLPPHVESQVVSNAQRWLIRNIWNNILPYYGSSQLIPKGTVEAVSRVFGKFYGEDAILLEFLMHYASSCFCQLKAREN